MSRTELKIRITKETEYWNTVYIYTDTRNRRKSTKCKLEINKILEPADNDFRDAITLILN